MTDVMQLEKCAVYLISVGKKLVVVGNLRTLASATKHFIIGFFFSFSKTNSLCRVFVNLMVHFSIICDFNGIFFPINSESSLKRRPPVSLQALQGRTKL